MFGILDIKHARLSKESIVKIKKLVTILATVLALVIASSSVASADPRPHGNHGGKGHKVAQTSQQAIASYQAALATLVSAQATAKAAPDNAAAAKAVKKAARQVKKSYSHAKDVIAKNFQNAVRTAKQTYRAAVKGKKDQADVVAAAKAARALAIAQASTTRDNDSALLKALKVKK